MAATITEGVLWELQADDSQLSAAYKRAEASAEKAGAAAQKAAQAGTQSFSEFGKEAASAGESVKKASAGADAAMAKTAESIEKAKDALGKLAREAKSTKVPEAAKEPPGHARQAATPEPAAPPAKPARDTRSAEEATKAAQDAAKAAQDAESAGGRSLAALAKQAADTGESLRAIGDGAEAMQRQVSESAKKAEASLDKLAQKAKPAKAENPLKPPLDKLTTPAASSEPRPAGATGATRSETQALEALGKEAATAEAKLRAIGPAAEAVQREVVAAAKKAEGGVKRAREEFAGFPKLAAVNAAAIKPLKDGADDLAKGLQRAGSSANDNLRPIADGAERATTGMLRAGVSVDKFNAGLDHVRTFAWNNTGFSGDQIDRVINPIQGLGRAIGVIPTIAVGAAAATVGALTLIGAKAQSVLAEIGDQARQAGVSADTLRGAEVVGARGGVTSDASRAAIANASQQFEAFKRNTGEVKDTIEKIDEKFLSVLDKTRSFGEFFDAIVQKIRALPQEEGLDLSKALLGEDAGKRLFDQIRAGALDMRALGAAADQAGGSIDESAKRAEEMQRRIDEAARIAEQKLLVAFQDLNSPIDNLKLGWYAVIGAIGDAVSKSEELRQVLQGLLHPIDTLMNAPRVIGNLISGQRERTIGRLIDLNAGRDFEAIRAQWLAAGPQGVVVPSAGVSRARYSARDDKDSASSGRSGSAAAERKSQIDSYIESLKQSAEIAQAEAENWGKSNVERAKAVALAKAKALAEKEGKTLTEEQTQRVMQFSEAESVAKQRVDDLRRAQQDLNASVREFSGDIVTAFDSLLVQGQKANQVFANLARTLASSALRGLLTGEGAFGKLFGLGGSDGGLGGILGGLFGGLKGDNFAGQAAGAVGPFQQTNPFAGFFAGKFANGGNIPSGSWGIAGERGPELITGPATVTPAGGFGGSKVTVHNYAAGVKVTPTISHGEVQLMVVSAIAANNAERDNSLLSRFENQQRRS